MKQTKKQLNEWELLKTTSDIVLASRLKILWEYVILGRKPFFIIEAWVHPRTKIISDLKLFVNYNREIK